MEKIKVKAFGKLAEIIGQEEFYIQKQDKIGSVRQNLILDFIELKDISFQVAMNHKIVSDDSSMEECTELALLPPFSGG